MLSNVSNRFNNFRTYLTHPLSSLSCSKPQPHIKSQYVKVLDSLIQSFQDLDQEQNSSESSDPENTNLKNKLRIHSLKTLRRQISESSFSDLWIEEIDELFEGSFGINGSINRKEDLSPVCSLRRKGSQVSLKRCLEGCEWEDLGRSSKEGGKVRWVRSYVLDTVCEVESPAAHQQRLRKPFPSNHRDDVIASDDDSDED